MTKFKNVPSDCFAIQKFSLNCFGLIYNPNVLRTVYTISLLMLLTIYLFSVFPEILKVYHEDFQKFFFSVLCGVGGITCLLCMYWSFWKRFELKLLFEKLQLLDELSNYKNLKSGNVFINQYKDVVRKQAYFVIAWILIAQIVFISMSVVLSLNKEKWILPFGSGSTIINNDNMQFIIQIIISAILFTITYVLLITYINVLTLICGHCKLLQKYIALSFTGHQGEIFKELDVKLMEKKIPDWESFKLHLRHIIPYHIGIIDTAKQAETVFSLFNFIFFGGASICICLLLYHTQLNIDTMETVKDAIILILGYSILIITSIYGEKVVTESEKIASVCYELDFVGSDLRIQKSLTLIMAISQRPITPTIGKLKPLGLRTILSIFQSIYSYYTILRNVMNE